VSECGLNPNEAGQGSITGHCNAHSGPKKTYLDSLRDYQLIKDSAPLLFIFRLKSEAMSVKGKVVFCHILRADIQNQKGANWELLFSKQRLLRFHSQSASCEWQPIAFPMLLPPQHVRNSSIHIWACDLIACLYKYSENCL